MKIIISVFAALLVSAKAYSSPLLDEGEHRELLQSIDAICGDTWCEGDSNWSFDAIRCDSETGCTLDLTMMPYDFSDEVSLAERVFSCDLSQFTDRTALIEHNLRGLQHTPELFDAVSDCISDLSATYGPMYIPVETSCRSLFDEKAPRSHNISLKGDVTGLDAAIGAVTRLVREEAKKVENCTLQTLPYYRDLAVCKETKSFETCTLPTTQGSFKVRRSLSTGVATVRYFPR